MNDKMQHSKVTAETIPGITPETTIIDVISRYRKTESILKRLEEETGTCICCRGLFLSLSEAAKRFGFDSVTVLADLNAVIDESIR